METKETKVKYIISTVLEVKLTDINDNLQQSELASWDSMKHLILISALEDEFKITLSDDDVIKMSNYNSIITIIRKHSDE